MLILFGFTGITLLAIVAVQLSYLIHMCNDIRAEQGVAQVPDQSAGPEGDMPDQYEEVIDEEEDLLDILGSEALQIKNDDHDTKIARLIKEIEAKKEVGEVYDLPHQATEIYNGEEYAE